MAKKSCKKGYYYCNTDEKCKKIPKGYHVMPTGYLMRDSAHKEDEKEETKKKNGNGTNGNGNGNGDSSGSSDGGGVSEAKEYGDHEVSMAKSQVKQSQRNLNRIKKALRGKTDKDNLPAWLQAKLTDTEHNTDAAAGYMDEARKSGDYSLRDWFTKSRASDGTPGWVQLGGKYAGKPCAKQPGQKTKPKCGSSKMARNLTDKEEESAFRRKNAKDPNPNRKGAPINVATEKKKKLNASYSDWRSDLEQLDELKCWKGYKRKKGSVPGEKGSCVKEQIVDEGLGLGLAAGAAALAAAPYLAKKFLKPKADKALQRGRNELHLQGNPIGAGARGLDKQSYEPEGELVDEGKKDACYKKVKARYDVWPSAYASGALVKCRKVGAANWGNQTKKESFSNWREELLSEGWEEKLKKMTPAQIADLKKANPGAAGKIDDMIRQMRSATPRPQGSGVQLPNVPRPSRTTTINVGDYAFRNQPGSAWQKAQQNPSAYRPGPGVKPDFSGVNRVPRSSAVRPSNVRPRGRGRLGLALTAATVAAPFVVGAVKKLFNREDYEYGNWKDDFQPTEFESVDIIKTKPLRASDWRSELNIIERKERKAKKDYDGDGEIETGEEEYKGSRDKAIKKAIAMKEDWQKSNRNDNVDGMSQSSVDAYRRENPGSKLQTAVTEKNPTGKRAERRKNFCSRSNGQRKMHNIDCSATPEKKICKARKRWRC